MKKSIYKKTVFLMLCIIIILLVSVAWKVGVFQNIDVEHFLKLIRNIINNAWFCSVCSSIIAVLLIYKWQIWYSKKKLKADFRCNEVIEGVYMGIEKYLDFATNIPERIKADKNEEIHKQMTRNAQTIVDFYKKNKTAILDANLSMSYEGNDLLLESIQSCFFINLNFELLGIVNNIKNRLPNLRKKYPEIEEAYERYEKKPNDEALIRLGDMLFIYFTDLKHMANYWIELLNYLEYDSTYIKLFMEIYNRKYRIEEVEEGIEITIDAINDRAKDIDKIVKKTIRSNRWKHFWDK